MVKCNIYVNNVDACSLCRCVDGISTAMIDNAIYGLLCVNYRCVHKGVSYYCKFSVDIIVKIKQSFLLEIICIYKFNNLHLP